MRVGKWCTFLPDFPVRLRDVRIIAKGVPRLDDKCINIVCHKRFGEIIAPEDILVELRSLCCSQEVKASVVSVGVN